jgi:hypothetical protein
LFSMHGNNLNSSSEEMGVANAVVSAVWPTS